MAQRIQLMVPKLMAGKGMNPTDLMRQTGLSYGTALRLSKGQGESISFDVLAQLCELFGVTPGDLLELAPAPKELGKGGGKKT